MKSKKKFGETTVGKILKTTAGLINPTLGMIVEGGSSVEDILSSIKGADAPQEDKVAVQELILETYEAEVSDRIAARNREATVAAAGGSDILFKTVGWGITLCFLGVNIATFAFDIPEDMMRAFDRAYGAVNAMMVMIVSYYFGSSMSSAQKTHLMNKE